jgi:hypothetical protein
MSEPGRARAEVEVPARLREAVADGWEGLTVLDDADPRAPLTLLCAARPRRLAALGRGGLVIGRRRAPGGHLVALTIAAPEGGAPAEDEAMTVGLDLAYSEARALVERAAARRRVRVVWAPAGGGPIACELVDIGEAGARHLRAALAAAAEWHLSDPDPAPAEPRGRFLGADATGRVVLAVAAEALAGLEGGRGRVTIGSALLGAAGAPCDPLAGGPEPDLELWLEIGTPVPCRRRMVVDLREEAQRDLAVAIAATGELLVVAVPEGPEPGVAIPPPCFAVTLCTHGRNLAAAAVAAAVRRADGNS